MSADVHLRIRRLTLDAGAVKDTRLLADSIRNAIDGRLQHLSGVPASDGAWTALVQSAVGDAVTGSSPDRAGRMQAAAVPAATEAGR